MQRCRFCTGNANRQDEATNKLGFSMKNLTDTPVPRQEVMTWYRVIHDIIPTNIRLNHIRTTNTDACLECGQSDTLEHRLMSCGEGSRTWNWLQCRIARILRTSATQIPSEWLTQQQFNLCPPPPPTAPNGALDASTIRKLSTK